MTRGSRSAAFVPRVFASAVFAGIAVFLVARTWLPARASLRQGRRRDRQHPSASQRLVRGRDLHHRRREHPVQGEAWLAGSRTSRCPIEAFERASGQRVSVTHDGRRPYEVRAERCGDPRLLGASTSADRRACARRDDAGGIGVGLDAEVGTPKQRGIGGGRDGQCQEHPERRRLRRQARSLPTSSTGSSPKRSRTPRASGGARTTRTRCVKGPPGDRELGRE